MVLFSSNRVAAKIYPDIYPFAPLPWKSFNGHLCNLFFYYNDSSIIAALCSIKGFTGINEAKQFVILLMYLLGFLTRV